MNVSPSLPEQTIPPCRERPAMVNKSIQKARCESVNWYRVVPSSQSATQSLIHVLRPAVGFIGRLSRSCRSDRLRLFLCFFFRPFLRRSFRFVPGKNHKHFVEPRRFLHFVSPFVQPGLYTPVSLAGPSFLLAAAFP